MDAPGEHFDKSVLLEQGPEQILQVLEEAIKSGKWVKITMIGEGPEQEWSTQKGIPASFDGNILWLTTESKGLISVDMSKIKMVQLPEAEKKESVEK